MKIRNLIILLITVLSLNSCFIGDTDDLEVVYKTTLIEVLCQTPELSTFCDMVYLTTPRPEGGRDQFTPFMAWKLQFSGSGRGCPDRNSVETVFAPTNAAFEAWFSRLGFTDLEDFVDRLPDGSIRQGKQDTIDILVKHHVLNKVKLINNVQDFTECNVEELIGGSEGYEMMFGRWNFLENPTTGQFIAASVTFGNQTTTAITSPDLSSTDGAVYAVNDVLAY
ncbi:MAG: fasciclin domain-containing protein [Bacteroidetes bacterium]|nr:fasciclin domain-containing protein [Bacteroidota bacterium]